MGRSLAVSVLLHVLGAVAIFLVGLGSSRRSPMPPVYQVSLVSAAQLAPRVSAPEPEPEKPKEEEPPPPEAEEKVPDTEKAPPKKKPEAEKPTPRPGPEAAKSQGADLPVSVEGKPFPYPWYLEQVYRKVASNWRPSSNTLTATVHFRIDARGRVGSIDVEESSGNFLFDQAARRAVEAADPMPPLPDGYGGDWLGVYFVFDTRTRSD